MPDWLIVLTLDLRLFLLYRSIFSFVFLCDVYHRLCQVLFRYLSYKAFQVISCFRPVVWCRLHIVDCGCSVRHPPIFIIPAAASSMSAFLIIYLAYKLNKYGDRMHPCCTPFPMLNQLVFAYSVFTNVCWLVYRFFVRTIKYVRHSHFLVYSFQSLSWFTQSKALL